MEQPILNITLVKQQRDALVPFLLVAALFFIPISVSLQGIFIILSALGLLLTPAFKNKRSFVLSEPWCKAAITLFLVLLVACCWSKAPYHTRLMFIDKYSKLLYLPLFAIGFQQLKIRTLGIYIFLLSMTITCIFSFILDTGDPTTPGRVFHDHITTGFMMAFAAYLSGLLMVKQHGRKRIVFMLLTLLFSYQLMFVNTGRIGYLLYFIVMILLMSQVLPWKHLGLGILGFCAIFSLCAYNSHALSFRLNRAVTDLTHYQQGDNITPVGIRLVFHSYAKSLFLSSPLIGQGTGGFSKLYQQYNTTLYKTNKAAGEYSNIMEPHSQYWLIASETGLLGIAAFLYFLGAILLSTFRLKEMKPVMLGMIVCFSISNFFDSQLLHSNVGYLFIVFCALCLGERVESHTHHLRTDSSDSSMTAQSELAH